jgi:hypothetical protein
MLDPEYGFETLLVKLLEVLDLIKGFFRLVQLDKQKGVQIIYTKIIKFKVQLVLEGS